MKVTELLDEIEEILNSAAVLPIMGKQLVDAQELSEIVKEIRIALPDEIQEAIWIKSQKERILEDAKNEYEAVLKEAQAQAEDLIESDDITVKAKMRADEIMRIAESNVKQLKIKTFDYVDEILFDLQNRINDLNSQHFGKMLDELQSVFSDVDLTLSNNRAEIKELALEAHGE